MTALIDNFRGEYKWLSNFWREEFTFDGRAWPSAEHAYQAMKTMSREDQEVIRKAATPRDAKRLGMKVDLRPRWDAMRAGVMLCILKAKFEQSSDLRESLLATEPMELVEGNTWGDTFFGECHGKGENWLGLLLMQVREELGDGSEPKELCSTCGGNGYLQGYGHGREDCPICDGTCYTP